MTGSNDGREAVDPGFAGRLCAVFGVDPDGSQLTSLPASSTRLWALQTAGGRFAVKEFPYHDGDRPAQLAVAAEFEHSLWRTSRLVMPEPVRASDGQLVVLIAGSRGAEVPVRMHRWLTGSAVPVPPAAVTSAAAGRALATIQKSGSALASRPSGSLRWWTSDPRDLLDGLTDAGCLSDDQAEKARASLDGAMLLLASGEQVPGSWIYTHCDHKPENSLLVGERVAVLDWDECGYCHPRQEAAESALRWAGVSLGEPSPEAFRAFLRGYEYEAGILGTLSPADFAKWVAAVAGWFWFTARRALGEFDDTEAERTAAAEMAIGAIENLHRTLAGVDGWAESFSER
jgi:Ser/Thr protein kinase RdoA (MazF antagonist)